MLGGWSKEAGFSAKYGKPMAVFFSEIWRAGCNPRFDDAILRLS